MKRPSLTKPLEELYRLRERLKPLLPSSLSMVEVVNLGAVNEAWPARAAIFPEPLAWPITPAVRAYLDADPKFRLRVPVLPPIIVSELPGGTLFVQHGAIATRGGALLAESANSLQKLIGCEAFGSLRQRPSHDFDRAPLTTIQSPGRGRNWYHWLTDSLPRLHALGALGAPVALAVPDSLFPAQLESLQLACPRNVEVVTFPRRACVEAAKLVLSPFTTESGSGLQRPEVAAWLRETIVAGVDPAPSPFGDRIFVLRPKTGGRHLENGEAIARALDLVPVDPGQLSFREQVRAFRDAKLVVGPHGANLAGILFATDARVVEVWPNGQGDGTAVQPYYWGMSAARGHDYHRVLHDQRTAVIEHDPTSKIPIRSFRADVDRVVAAARA